MQELHTKRKNLFIHLMRSHFSLIAKSCVALGTPTLCYHFSTSHAIKSSHAIDFVDPPVQVHFKLAGYSFHVNSWISWKFIWSYSCLWKNPFCNRTIQTWTLYRLGWIQLPFPLRSSFLWYQDLQKIWSQIGEVLYFCKMIHECTCLGLNTVTIVLIWIMQHFWKGLKSKNKKLEKHA